MDKDKLYLEDLLVGMRFKAGPEKVDEDAMIAFAKEFDNQVFHTDPEAAKKTVFKGLASSGWYTAALTMRMLVSGGMPFACGSIGFGAEISWPKPVRAGDQLEVETEIIDITPSRSKPNQATVTLRTATINQHGETVQILTSKNLIFKRGYRPS